MKKKINMKPEIMSDRFVFPYVFNKNIMTTNSRGKLFILEHAHYFHNHFK
jgi:hypothetical protein